MIGVAVLDYRIAPDVSPRLLHAIIMIAKSTVPTYFVLFFLKTTSLCIPSILFTYFPHNKTVWQTPFNYKMFRSSIIRPSIKGWMTPSFRCVSRHRLVAPSLLTPLSPGPYSANIPNLYFQTLGLHEKVNSLQGYGKRPSASSADGDDEKGVDGNLTHGLLFMFGFLFFMISTKRRKERLRLQEEAESGNEE